MLLQGEALAKQHSTNKNEPCSGQPLQGLSAFHFARQPPSNILDCPFSLQAQDDATIHIVLRRLTDCETGQHFFSSFSAREFKNTCERNFAFLFIQFLQGYNPNGCGYTKNNHQQRTTTDTSVYILYTVRIHVYDVYGMYPHVYKCIRMYPDTPVYIQIHSDTLHIHHIYVYGMYTECIRMYPVVPSSSVFTYTNLRKRINIYMSMYLDLSVSCLKLS